MGQQPRSSPCGAAWNSQGDGMGHLYGHVTVFDRPHRFATRGRIMPTHGDISRFEEPLRRLVEAS
jgi:hypothetical protein